MLGSEHLLGNRNKIFSNITQPSPGDTRVLSANGLDGSPAEVLQDDDRDKRETESDTCVFRENRRVTESL